MKNSDYLKQQKEPTEQDIQVAKAVDSSFQKLKLMDHNKQRFVCSVIDNVDNWIAFERLIKSYSR